MNYLSKTLLGLVLMLMCSVYSYGQEHEFGEISKEELLEQSYPLDSSANAAVLYESKKIRYYYNGIDFQLITDVYKRIKLYNKNGFDYANHEIRLFNKNSTHEQISGFKAVTYSLVNGEIVDTKLKKSDIFKTEFSDNYDQIKFTMPSLQEGSIIEYKYSILSTFVFNIGRINLQYNIPIKKLDVELLMPDFYGFKKFTTGYLPINLRESVGTSYGFKRVINKISSRNVPAFKREPFSGNSQNYKSSIVYELEYIKYRNGRVKQFSSTWEDVTKNIYTSSRFGDELKKRKYYTKDIDSVVKGLKSPLEKITAIYDYVKEKVVWNKRYSVYTQKGVEKAYEEGNGNSAEINLMLTSMLSYEGFYANPVILGTSNRVVSLFPTRRGFNYVITRVKLPNGNTFYLDATDKFGQPNILPNRVLKGVGRVIAENGSSQMVDLRPKIPSENRYSIQCSIDDAGTLNGVFNAHYLDYAAHDYRVRNESRNDETKEDRFKKQYSIDEIENYLVKGLEDFGKGVVERSNFIDENQIEMIDNEMFFSPLLFLKDEENVFKSNEREYPVDFGYGFSNIYRINIAIPSGYEVSEIPEQKAFKLPDNLGMFSYKSNVINGEIQIVAKEVINEPIITSDYYPVLKQFYNQIIQKESDQVVLKKI